MKKKQDLFQLIKSLSKSEKRYFKLFSAFHTIGDKNNYVKLFEVIEKQDEYDEEAIIRIFRKENFIKRLPVTRDYLYNLILRSLHYYHSNNSIDTKLKDMLHYADILYKKELYQQCERILIKAKKIAGYYENYLRLYEIFKITRQVMAAKAYYGKTEKEISNFYKEGYDVLEKLKNTTDYMQLSSKLHLKIQKHGIIRKAEELTLIKDIIEHPLLKKEENALSFDAKRWLYNIHHAYTLAIGDLENCYRNSKKEMILFESFIEKQSDNKEGYVISLSNHLISCLRTKRAKEFTFYLKKLKSIAENIKTNIKSAYYATIISRLYTHQTAFFIATGQFKKGVISIGSIEEKITALKDKIKKGALLNLYFNIAYLYFGAGKYKSALSSLNKILNYPETNTREDIHSFTRIFLLIIHYELGNIELLAYTVKSTYRFLYKRNRLHQIETIILKYIRKDMPKINDQEKLIVALSKLRSQLKAVSDNNYIEKRAMEYYFDIIAWLDSKILNKSFEEVVKEKFDTSSKQFLKQSAIGKK